MQPINCTTRLFSVRARVKPCSAGLASTEGAAVGWDPTKTQQGLQTKSFPTGSAGKGSACRALPFRAAVEEEDEGHYLTGSPRLFVRPVLVVADVPPLDLQGVGGGAAAAEGARHLHILPRLRRHVVRGLGEESCWRQSRGCGARGTEHCPGEGQCVQTHGQSHGSAWILPWPNRPSPYSRAGRSLSSPASLSPQYPLTTPAEVPPPTSATLQRAVGGKGGSRSLCPPAPTASLRPLPQNECGTRHTSEVKEINGARSHLTQIRT